MCWALLAGGTASPRASSGRLPEPATHAPAPRVPPTPSPSCPWAFCSLPFQKGPCAMIRLEYVFRFGLRKINGLHLVRPCKKSLIILKSFLCVKPSQNTLGFWIGWVPSPEGKTRLPLGRRCLSQQGSAPTLSPRGREAPFWRRDGGAGPYVVANGSGCLESRWAAGA